MLFGSLMMVAFWVAVIWAVAALTRRPEGRRGAPPPRAEPTALQILERRYANDELSDEGVEAKKRRLLG